LEEREIGIKFNPEILEKWQTHLKEERIAFCQNEDQIKYNREGAIEWMFSPKYGWYELSDKKRNELICTIYLGIFMANIMLH
jgi:hypothetical protein